MKILFIENHETFSRIVVSEFLRGHEVTVTPSLSGARALMAQHEFELMLVDYDLDDGKGAEIVGEIASITPRPKIIAVSSRDDGNDFLTEAGADAICCKIHFHKIDSIIRAVFGEANSTITTG